MSHSCIKLAHKCFCDRSDFSVLQCTEWINDITKLLIDATLIMLQSKDQSNSSKVVRLVSE